ncbi:hypothetical protein HDV06_000814 [Boothiomyces sp. JEL0866]|nr:hypothetical protein HDV06_000814 [Boothiomyces sp. JEL0866]
MTETIISSFFTSSFVDTQDFKKLNIFMDGFSLDKMAHLQRKLIKAKHQAGEKSVRAKFSCVKTIRHLNRDNRLNDIGLLDETGKLFWVPWLELSTTLGLDFSRLLAKGSKYKMFKDRTTNISPSLKAFYCEFWKRLVEERKFNDKNIKKMYLNRFDNVNLAFEWLEKQNIIVRKEDKGLRFVLCKKGWEEAQNQKYLQTYKVREAKRDSMDIRGFYLLPYMYFNPKTHKSEPIDGRPIVSWSKSRSKWEKGLKRELTIINNRINNYVYPSTNMIVREVVTTEEEFRNGWRILIGDLKNMFLCIPREELLGEVSIHSHTLMLKVEKFLDNSVYTYNNTPYILMDGICMGSRLSPLLASIWLSSKVAKLRTRLRKVKASGGFYVDDLVLRYLPQDETSEEFVKKIVKSMVYPLEVRWSDDLKTLGCDFGPGRQHRRVLIKNPIPPLPSRYETFLPEIKKNVMSRIRHVLNHEDVFAVYDTGINVRNYSVSWRSHWLSTLSPELQIQNNADFEYNEKMLSYIGLKHNNRLFENCKLCNHIRQVYWMKENTEDWYKMPTLVIYWKPIFNTSLGMKVLKDTIRKAILSGDLQRYIVRFSGTTCEAISKSYIKRFRCCPDGKIVEHSFMKAKKSEL